jgi:hypothetical protein
MPEFNTAEFNNGEFNTPTSADNPVKASPLVGTYNAVWMLGIGGGTL